MQVFEVLSPGLLTTVQDRGRYGYQAFGMPVAGAMDDYAFRAANILVGNDPNTAALEITLLGPRLRVLAPTVLAIAGADLGACLNEMELPLWQSVAVQAGDEISFSGPRSGCRAYLAVAGGIDVPVVMGSCSTYLRGETGGFGGRALAAGDVLSAGEATPSARALVGRRPPPELIPSYSCEIDLRVIMGPQDEYFTEAGKETFLSSTYTITNESDRMGCRLAGPKIEHVQGPDILSDGIPLGAVQVPGHGFPIILLADRQTVGGYTKIATVIGADICRIGQAKPGDRVRFHATTRTEAVELLREHEERLKRLAAFIHQDIGRMWGYFIKVKGEHFEVTVQELK
ncbi:MAG: biotin-dependent carboxyltransferase [Firmicutes bacterium]|nr:biotin-dependent carboxyltransferase [Bacillota bacterium]